MQLEGNRRSRRESACGKLLERVWRTMGERYESGLRMREEGSLCSEGVSWLAWERIRGTNRRACGRRLLCEELEDFVV